MRRFTYWTIVTSILIIQNVTSKILCLMLQSICAKIVASFSFKMSTNLHIWSWVIVPSANTLKRTKELKMFTAACLICITDLDNVFLK